MTGQMLAWLWRSWQPCLRHAGLVTLCTGQGKFCVFMHVCWCSLYVYVPAHRALIWCQTQANVSDIAFALGFGMFVMHTWSLMRFANATAGMCTLVVVQGSNLIRHDLTLQYRISPADAEYVTRAAYVLPSRFKEWNAFYLIEDRVRPLYSPMWPARLHRHKLQQGLECCMSTAG